MKATAKYLILTVKHKWFVIRAGLKTKAPMMRLIIHDWSKFLPSELPHYGRQFFGKADDSEGFARCWLNHQNRNPHHWEYWIPRTGHNRGSPPYPDNEPLPMPNWAVREMVADWLGASRAYDGRWPDVSDWGWFKNAYSKMRLHPTTVIMVEKVLQELIAAR